MRVLPSGRPPEESMTLVQDDPTWAIEYDHFKRLVADRAPAIWPMIAGSYRLLRAACGDIAIKDGRRAMSTTPDHRLCRA